jgi:hypothetical protein
VAVLDEDLTVGTVALIRAGQVETAMRAGRGLARTFVNVDTGLVGVGRLVAGIAVTDECAFSVLAASVETNIRLLGTLININTR